MINVLSANEEEGGARIAQEAWSKETLKDVVEEVRSLPGGGDWAASVARGLLALVKLAPETRAALREKGVVDVLGHLRANGAPGDVVDEVVEMVSGA